MATWDYGFTSNSAHTTSGATDLNIYNWPNDTTAATNSTFWTDNSTSAGIDWSTSDSTWTIISPTDYPIIHPTVPFMRWEETPADRVQVSDWGVPTPEQIKEREQRERKIQIANKKGEDLVKQVLGDVLYRRYQMQGYVDIPSIKHKGLAYRIRPRGMIGIVRRQQDGRWTEQAECLCIHARQCHVPGDEVAIKVMLCRHDEEMLWNTANKYQHRAA